VKTIQPKTKSASKTVTAPHTASATPGPAPEATDASSSTHPAPSPASPAPPALASAIANPSYVPPGELPPAAGVIGTPEGWKPMPKKKTSARGQRPRGPQVTDATAAAKELTQSPTYGSDFGTHAPSAGQIGFVMTNAATWRDRWQQAKMFLAYCAEQRATWEDAALGQMDTLKPVFDFLTQREPKVVERYPVTGKYLGVASTIATRGAASRKAKAKEAAKSAPAEAPAATPAPATSVKSS
jgi:hypothetical protein